MKVAEKIMSSQQIMIENYESMREEIAEYGPATNDIVISIVKKYDQSYRSNITNKKNKNDFADYINTMHPCLHYQP